MATLVDIRKKQRRSYKIAISVMALLAFTFFAIIIGIPSLKANENLSNIDLSDFTNQDLEKIYNNYELLITNGFVVEENNDKITLTHKDEDFVNFTIIITIDSNNYKEYSFTDTSYITMKSRFDAEYNYVYTWEGNGVKVFTSVTKTEYESIYLINNIHDKIKQITRTHG